MTRAFLDANVFIYTAGRDHPLRGPSAEVIRLAGDYPSAFVTDAEVFQEMLHRYMAIRILNELRSRFEEFLALMENRVEPMSVDDVHHAATLAHEHASLSARDLVHLAVMRRIECDTIVTADSGFDGIEGITRLDPMLVDQWRSLVTDAASP